MTDDITLTGETERERRFSMAAETEELRGCWRIFFIVLAVLTVLVIGVIIWQIVFVIEPWKTDTERRSEERAQTLAELPPIPDVVGLSIVDVYFQLRDEYPEVLLFDSTHHGVEISDDIANLTDLNVGQAITLMNPAPGQPASETLNVWIGPRPEVPEGIAPDSFWFDHSETTRDSGTYPCLSCHPTTFCSRCHEDRLKTAGTAFLADPENAPELAEAVSEATGVELDHVVAVFRGLGWYRVDILLDDPGLAREVAEQARLDAVKAFPSAFAAEPDAQTILMRWVHAGSQEPIVEIGLERSTYEDLQWLTVFPDDIPWVVDRYSIVGGASEE